MTDAIFQIHTDASSIGEDQRNQAPWLVALKQQAAQSFQIERIPNKKNEKWKYTNLRPLRQQQFFLHQTLARETDLSQAYALTDSREHTFIFVDGRWHSYLPAAETLGVTVLSLQQALPIHGETIQTILKQNSAITSNPFTHLNEMFLEHGLFIKIANKIHCQAPIHFIHTSSASSQEACANLPHHILDLGAGSSCRFYETYMGSTPTGNQTTSTPHFTNCVVDINLEAEAELAYGKIQLEDQASFHFSEMRVLQKSKSKLHAFHYGCGGAISRDGLHIALAGERSQAYLGGVLQQHKSQQGELNLYVEHGASYTESQQVYRALCADQSTGTFSGKIKVKTGIKKVNAHQLNNNLLLGEQAEMNSNPQLEIDTDDLKCTHGSSVGKLREEEIFYLLSRGISKKVTEQILCQAFASKVVLGITNATFRNEIQNKIAKVRSLAPMELYASMGDLL